MAERKKKKANKKHNIHKRAHVNRVARQEELRDRLAAKSILDWLEKGFQEYDEIAEAIKKLPDEEVSAIDRLKARATILAKKMDHRFKQLNKVLPDLKSQDISGSLSHTHYNPSPTDRATAAYLGMPLDQYMEAKEAGEIDIPEPPPLPERLQGTKH